MSRIFTAARYTYLNVTHNGYGKVIAKVLNGKTYDEIKEQLGVDSGELNNMLRGVRMVNSKRLENFVKGLGLSEKVSVQLLADMEYQREHPAVSNIIRNARLHSLSLMHPSVETWIKSTVNGGYIRKTLKGQLPVSANARKAIEDLIGVDVYDNKDVAHSVDVIRSKYTVEAILTAAKMIQLTNDYEDRCEKPDTVNYNVTAKFNNLWG